MHNRPRVTPVLGAVGGIVRLEFLHGINRRLKGNLTVRHVIEVDPINHEVHGIFPVAGGVDAETIPDHATER